jgi:hypothetical protein
MKRHFTCTLCGHETVFDPRDCPRFLQLSGPPSTRRKGLVVHRVRCATCGKEQDVDTGGAVSNTAALPRVVG